MEPLKETWSVISGTDLSSLTAGTTDGRSLIDLRTPPVVAVSRRGTQHRPTADSALLNDLAEPEQESIAKNENKNLKNIDVVDLVSVEASSPRANLPHHAQPEILDLCSRSPIPHGDTCLPRQEALPVVHGQHWIEPERVLVVAEPDDRGRYREAGTEAPGGSVHPPPTYSAQRSSTTPTTNNYQQVNNYNTVINYIYGGTSGGGCAHMYATHHVAGNRAKFPGRTYVRCPQCGFFKYL